MNVHGVHVNILCPLVHFLYSLDASCQMGNVLSTGCFVGNVRWGVKSFGTEDGHSWGVECSTSVPLSSFSGLPVSIWEITPPPLCGERIISSDRLPLWKPNGPNHPLPTIA